MAFDGIKSLFNAAADGLQRLKFNAWTLGGRGAEIFEKSAEALQLERINPLRGVDEWRLGQIFDDARDGIFADLAWLYNEIEGVEPALSACCEMRESAASECGWLVKTADADRTRGFDAKLADEQRIALLSEFGAVEDDLADLASHLVSAFFRGAAHAEPLWNADGSLAGFKKLDLWNFAFDRKTGIWYWNADASRDEGTFQPIPPGELVTLAVSSARHVDHAALPIFIRSALGAKRYGVWLDRFGIPPVAVIMPPNAEKAEQANYMDLARKFARGGNGILPNGSAVSYGTEARAVCPFPDFIRFQQEQIYMIGIGRVQSGANDAANLGGNAAGVVEAGFTRLVRRDARRIARAINDTVTAKVLQRLYPGKPALAQFAWDTEQKRTSREVLEDAGLARTAGLSIDIDQVSELTGYKLEKAPETPPQGGFGELAGGLNAKTPFKNDENGFKNAPGDSDGQGDPSGLPPSQIAKKRPSGAEGVLEAFAKDTSAAAKAVEAFLKDPSKEAAEALAARLPELLPEDPEMATVIADAMAEAIGETIGGEAKNSIANPCPRCHRNMPKDGVCSFCAKRAENMKKVAGLVDELAKKSPDGKKPGWAHKEETLGEVDAKTAAAISAAMPEINAEGQTFEVDTTQLQHALNDHGVGRETNENQIPITPDDLRKIPDVLSDYDEIVPGKGVKDGKKNNAVIFKKKFSDGTLACVEIDQYSEKRKSRILRFKTMWKEKIS